jgi:hypothetical protein
MGFEVLTAASMKMRAFWDYRRVVSLEKTDVSEARTASIMSLMMEASHIEK